MDNKTVTLRLGAEEVVFLLKALNIKTLPGLGDDPTNGLSEDQINRAIAAGFNSLRARGWVKEAVGDKPMSIESAIIAAFVVCASAPNVLFVSRQPADGPAQVLYVHLGEHMTVSHSIIQPGVHQFVGTVDAETTVAEVAKLLHLEKQPRPSTKPISIPGPLLDQVTAHVRENRLEQAEVLLRDNGVTAELAAAFVNSVAKIKANAIVSLLHLRPPQENAEPMVDGFTLVEGSVGFWHLKTQQEEGREVLAIEPVTAQENRKRIAALISSAAKQG